MNDQHLHIQSSAALHQNRNIKAEFKEGSLRTNVNVKIKKKTSQIQVEKEPQTISTKDMIDRKYDKEH